MGSSAVSKFEGVNYAAQQAAKAMHRQRFTPDLNR
jgi:hypothetical protein